MLFALDTDILTKVLHGDPIVTSLLANIPIAEQAIPVVVLEEMLRGRLNTIRQTEAGRGSMTLDAAYEVFRKSIQASRSFNILPLTPAAILLAAAWKKQRIRVAPHDFRIAAICIIHGATLITRNRRDFERVPGLTFEVW